jgi:hypothetical protein
MTSPESASPGGAATPAAATAAAVAAAKPTALVVFTATTFLSALLLFSVQPMFAKMVLPVLGGAPSVWAVALCFFQGALLAGYCYAHASVAWLPARIAGPLHLAICLLAFLVLPIALPAAWGEPPPGEPYLWQLGLFAAAIGLPFVAVSANAPLLQAWFHRTGDPRAADPYFLYAASNLGSFVALLGYPFVLEPAFGLAQLSRFWTIGYALLVAALALCLLLVVQRNGARSGSETSTEPAPDGVPAASPTSAMNAPDIAAPGWKDRLSWIGLALVPAALLTAFTTHVSTDVASAPLIWVIPLALYLLTFVLVFRTHPTLFVPLLLAMAAGGYLLSFHVPPILLDIVRRSLPFGIAADWRETVTMPVWIGVTGALVAVGVFVAAWKRRLLAPGQWLLWVHLFAVLTALLVMAQTRHTGWVLGSVTGVIAFFAATLVAHRTLYEARPAPRHLTEFYLWMSFGGVLGGIFAALLAPRLFSEVFEYPLLLALTLACRPRAFDLGTERGEEAMRLWLILSGGLLAIYWVPWALAKAGSDFGGWGATPVVVSLLAAAALYFHRHPPRQLVAGLVAFAALSLLPSAVKVGDAQRSYFGVYRVYASSDGQFNLLTHGTTLHGAQRIRDDTGAITADATPATYYHPGSPMARIVSTAREVAEAAGRKLRVGVIGLGTGSMACHAEEGEAWRFFEIDPLMVDIATKSGLFTFMTNCQPKPDIVIGDARLTLAKEQADHYDLIVVDAFSSDAVPVHLMTAEAIRLYRDKIRPDGLFLLHISNRYLDLDGVLAATAPTVPGLHGLIASDENADGSYASTTSTAAIFARDAEVLAKVKAWTDIEITDLPATKLRPWTDDYSDILGPFRSKIR